MDLPLHAPVEPESTDWDVAVIGAGMGGATIGFDLARRGWRVLFLEKGLFVQRDAEVARGELGDQREAPESRLKIGHWPLPLEGVMRRGDRLGGGRWTDRIRGALNIGKVEFFAPLGCGTGGSTIIFGATLERFFPSDFAPKACFPEITGSTLPEAWPISYDELEPWYRQAEQLFRVRGTPDPLHPATDALPEPAPLNAQDQDVLQLFQRKGLHPYRIHIGCRFVSGCDGCPGKVCLRDCKSDAGSVCVVPAVEKYDAKVMSQCEVTALEADDAGVSRIRCHWQGRERAISAHVVVLAAGALMSPVLLLNSKGKGRENGLANGSGLVGRNLMLHSGDMIAVRADRGRSPGGFNKSLSINDLYVYGGRKLGNVQSTGVQIDTGSVFAHLQTSLSKAPRWMKSLAPPLLLRIIARVAAYYFRNAVAFGAIVEDLPYHENRVVPDADAKNGMRFEYEYSEELGERNALLRRGLVKLLGRTRVLSLTRPMNLNFGHPCGTIRFGDDPATSVLDRNNRAHEVDNLYVVDASFFPSSGGTNPSLTIAANALRVGAVIDARLSKESRR